MNTRDSAEVGGLLRVDGHSVILTPSDVGYLLLYLKDSMDHHMKGQVGQFEEDRDGDITATALELMVRIGWLEKTETGYRWTNEPGRRRMTP